MSGADLFPGLDLAVLYPLSQQYGDACVAACMPIGRDLLFDRRYGCGMQMAAMCEMHIADLVVHCLSKPDGRPPMEFARTLADAILARVEFIDRLVHRPSGGAAS